VRGLGAYRTILTTPGATWLSSADAAGIAAGGFVAGVLVEGPGTETAFLTGAALAAVAALLVLARA